MTAPPDHLRTWLTVRDAVPWREVRPCDESPFVPVRDGALHHIRTVDHGRDPARAAALRSALTHARACAAEGTPLRFALLSAWQCRVLGVAAAPFRGYPAFAKGGRERYGIDSDTPHRFDRCLRQVADPALALPARAARVYLDVCFFHPFVDGNARAAYLALDFVLAGAGIVLDQVGPVRLVSRRADDAAGALALADLVSTLIAGARRRAAHATP
ncbi:Fic family protein [Actinophytocola sediminis]